MKCLNAVLLSLIIAEIFPQGESKNAYVIVLQEKDEHTQIAKESFCCMALIQEKRGLGLAECFVGKKKENIEPAIWSELSYCPNIYNHIVQVDGDNGDLSNSIFALVTLAKKAPGYFAASYSSIYPEQTDFGEIKENSAFILNALDKRFPGYMENTPATFSRQNDYYIEVLVRTTYGVHYNWKGSPLIHNDKIVAICNEHQKYKFEAFCEGAKILCLKTNTVFQQFVLPALGIGSSGTNN